jgi:hypothetical protein
MKPLLIIKKTSGKFCKIKYRKKNGEVGVYNVRTGVKKGLTGVGKYPVPNSVTVYSVSKKNIGYKTFLEEGIISIECGKIKWNKIS